MKGTAFSLPFSLKGILSPGFLILRKAVSFQSS